MKKDNKSSSAGTKDESSTNAQDKQVSQPIANEMLSAVCVHAHPIVNLELYKCLDGSFECILRNLSENEIESSFFIDEYTAKEIIKLLNLVFNNLPIQSTDLNPYSPTANWVTHPPNSR